MSYHPYFIKNYSANNSNYSPSNFYYVHYKTRYPYPPKSSYKHRTLKH